MINWKQLFCWHSWEYDQKEYSKRITEAHNRIRKNSKIIYSYFTFEQTCRKCGKTRICNSDILT